MEKYKDSVLIVWLICFFIWDIFLIGGTAYLVFYKGISGWWFLLAFFCSIQITIFDVLKKRYDIEG